MSFGDSQVSICNSALAALGEQPIVSLADNVKAAIVLNQQYDMERRALLRAHDWNFARAQAQLAASTTAPLFNYDNAFPLPSDCLRLLDLPDNDLAVWELFGNSLYTDEGAPLSVVYTRDVTDPTAFDPVFVKALALSLAVIVAIPLTGAKSKKEDAAAELAQVKQEARLYSSQENSPREWDADLMLRSRQ